MTLTSAEKREFDRQYRHALRGRIELDGLTFPPSEQLVRCVESIVASRERAAAEAVIGKFEALADEWNRLPDKHTYSGPINEEHANQIRDRSGEIRNGN